MLHERGAGLGRIENEQNVIETLHVGSLRGQSLRVGCCRLSPRLAGRLRVLRRVVPDEIVATVPDALQQPIDMLGRGPDHLQCSGAEAQAHLDGLWVGLGRTRVQEAPTGLEVPGASDDRQLRIQAV